RPAFEDRVASGRIGAWGITGIALPRTVLDVIAADPPPAAVQCATNLLDSVGAIYVHDEPFRPREIVAAAAARGCGVLGIRAVQAGALTDALDRDLPADDLDRADFARAAPFRCRADGAGAAPGA